MFGSIGSMELFIILLVVLLLFGSKQLPQMARNLGKAMRDFQNMTQNARSEIHRILEEEDKRESDSKKDLKG
jgi:sec-independent protein translocase protein TatA